MAEKEKKHSRKSGRRVDPSTWFITAVGMALAWVLGMFLPHRTTVLLSMIGCGVSLIALVMSFRSDPKGKPPSRVTSLVLSFGVVAGMVSFFGVITTFGAYSFYKESFIPFWEISLALGLSVGIFVTIKWVWKSTGWGGRIGSIALCTFLMFFLCMISLCHLNYLLDFQPPVEKHAVIAEKETTRHHKSPDSYEFEMTVDSETFDLEVDWLEYQRYEVGDTYTFKEYKGAFGKPFYIAED